jgi:membrane-associated phospholipid phosphatase
MKQLQKIEDRYGIIPLVSGLLGKFCSGEVLPIYFAIMYWVLDRYKCMYGIWLVPTSEIVNGLLKWHYHTPRPGWVDRTIKLREWSDEYSFPSSHAQIVWSLANFFTFTSISKLRTKLLGTQLATTALVYWYLLVGPYLFAFLVSLSRVYDGLHYPRDITVGAGVGVVLSAVYIEILPHARDFLEQQSRPMRLFYFQLIPLFFMIVLKYSYERVCRNKKLQEEWASVKGEGKYKGRRVSPHDVPYVAYTGMVGVLSGLGVAHTFADFFPLHNPPSLTAALARVLIGNVGFIGMFLGIRVIEKSCSDGTVMQRVWRFIRYAMIPIFIICLAPVIFNHLEI